MDWNFSILKAEEERMKIKIDQEWIDEWLPCKEAIEWWDRESDPLKILNKLIKEKRYEWANWFIVRIMEDKECIQYAIFAAKEVLDFYEKESPEDKRSQRAIEKYLKDLTAKNKKATREATRAMEAAAGATWAVEVAAGAAAGAGAREKLRLILNYGVKLLRRKG